MTQLPNQKTVITAGEIENCERWKLPQVESGEHKPVYGPLTARQLEYIQTQAYNEGFAQGQQDGYTAGFKEAKNKITALEHLFLHLFEPAQQLDEAVDQQLLDLLQILLSQFLQREINLQPDYVINIVKQAKALLPVLTRHVCLYLHPDDLILIKETKIIPEQGENPWRIIEDKNLLRGGCRIESDTTRLDASLEAQIRSMMQTLQAPETSQEVK